MSSLSVSILAANFCNLADDCQMALDAGAEMLHFDVMDAHFVPNISFGVPVLASLHKGLPSAFYDVHLMMRHPLAYVAAFAKAGASLINVHLECEDEIDAVLDAVAKTGCKVGLTIKPETPVEALVPYLNRLDLVLVMSVEPGFGGQSFQWEALEKVKALVALRTAHKASYQIEIDGGVDETTAGACVAAGVDILVAGSAVFAAENPASAIKAILANESQRAQ